MWEKFRAIFTIPELRMKILFTLLLLAVFRVGYQIPLPIVDEQAILDKMRAGGDRGGFFEMMETVSTFSAADLKKITIFGMGIMPYISASIILQLLSSVWKPLEELKKEGETGRKKINEYTRYLTLLMCFFQGAVFLSARIAEDNSVLNAEFCTIVGGVRHLHWAWYITSIIMMTCGTMFVMWIGEQIDEFGIGNGISILIMAGILAQMPDAMTTFLVTKMKKTLTGFQEPGVETLIVLIFLFIAVVACVVFITLGQRQIPTQSAKHVRGRRVYGGSRQYLPLKLNQSGVMPIIFASSLLLLPAMLFGAIAAQFDANQSMWWAGVFHNLRDTFQRGDSFVYNVTYVALIFFFAYFWTAITFNPKEMAENLKDFGTFIPGYRPGRRTADYLEKVMMRITYVGASFLSVVAIVPTIVSSLLQVDPNVASFYGGTGLLIAVSVAFDLIQKIDSHLVMRDYRGLLEH